MKHIAIIDDHPLFAQAIGTVVGSLAPGAGIKSYRQLNDFLSAVNGGPDPEPDLVLLDLRLPDCNDTEGVERVHRRLPGVPLLVMSGFDEPMRVRKVLAAGASAFFSKAASPEKIMQALDQALTSSGPGRMPAVNDARRGEASGARGNGHFVRDARGREVLLTARQAEVLDELALGKSNKEIALDLGLSIDTVKVHVKDVLHRLGVENRTQAASLHTLKDRGA